VVRLKNAKCKCNKDDWRLMDFYFGRCKICLGWIPAADVFDGWNRYYGNEE